MEFPWKYLYLILGLTLLMGSVIRIIWLKFYKCEDFEELSSNDEFPEEVELLIILVSMVMAGILLRQAYVMFFGLTRSTVF